MWSVEPILGELQDEHFTQLASNVFGFQLGLALFEVDGKSTFWEDFQVQIYLQMNPFLL